LDARNRERGGSRGLRGRAREGQETGREREKWGKKRASIFDNFPTADSSHHYPRPLLSGMEEKTPLKDETSAGAANLVRVLLVAVVKNVVGILRTHYRCKIERIRILPGTRGLTGEQHLWLPYIQPNLVDDTPRGRLGVWDIFWESFTPRKL